MVNPEKSLTATIRSGPAGEGERSFRYAPLSSGLDIVRKTLGQHEIATLQTTAIDQTAGMINLTTTLAIHDPWMRMSIQSSAHGRSADLRSRYALFTLVGIAGEDNLDAPDMCGEPLRPSPSGLDRSFKPRDGQFRVPLGMAGNGQARGGMKGEPLAVLHPDQSAILREKLLIEVGNITSADLAATWAGEALTAKTSLTATDAKLVEDAFERKLSELSSSESKGSPVDDSSGGSLKRPAKSTPTPRNRPSKDLLAKNGDARRKREGRSHLRSAFDVASGGRAGS